MIPGHRLTELPQAFERKAKVVMRLGEIGLDGEGLVKAGNGILQLPRFLERKPKVVMCFDVIGLDGEGLRDEIDGNVVFSHLMGDHPKQMQGDRLTGVGLQYLLINAFSLRQATRSVVLQGEVYALLDG